ncbi:carboxylating nicotinate-nucleotide diphosphorylase [Candidatus Omnitrophota bacterium]
MKSRMLSSGSSRYMMSYARNFKLKGLIKRALAEDIGKGDITNSLLFTGKKKVRAVILAGESGVVCGIGVASMVFKLKDRQVKFKALVKDGQRIKNGQVLARIYGRASSILSSERVALNFLGLLSGIATRSAEFVNKVRKSNVKIMDTRKTIPGLRQLQKYAVSVGGGHNHRFRLDEMVLVKDNHLAALGFAPQPLCVKSIIKGIKEKKPSGVKLEVEVKNLKEFRQALKAGPDIIMFDNMKTGDIRKAVTIARETEGIKHKMKFEASGNINLKNIRAFAQTGVDIISLGVLTKEIRCIDFSLEIKGG